jgi:ribosome recycling factor
MSVADDVLKDQHARIQKTLDHFRQELLGVRTGRASLHLLDGIKVDYYGTPTPLNQVATLAVADARLITVKPWEKKLAIRNEPRDAKELIEQAEKDGDVSADEAKKAFEKVQKETDDGVKKVDEMVVAKEKEVMTV